MLPVLAGTVVLGDQARGSYKGYASGFAQLLASPTHLISVPMIINTNKRLTNDTSPGSPRAEHTNAQYRKTTTSVAFRVENFCIAICAMSRLFAVQASGFRLDSRRCGTWSSDGRSQAHQPHPRAELLAGA